MKRRLFASGVVAAALAAGTPPAAAEAPSSGRNAEDGTSAALQAVFHDPGAGHFTAYRVQCPDASGACALGFDGTTTESGDVQGSTTYHGLLYPGDGPSHTFRWEVDETFTGSVAGCGRGTARWTGAGYGDLTTFDAATQSARMSGKLTIVVGSGTAGLRGLHGILSVDARAHGVPPAAQDGTLTGEVSCNGRPNSRS